MVKGLDIFYPVVYGYSALRLKPDGNSVLSTREEKRFFASVPASCARPG